MKAAFVVNARNKEKYAFKAAESGILQTYPCQILLSDQFSDDGTFNELLRAAETVALGHPDSQVKVLKCPVDGKYSMRTNNAHFDWLWRQTDPEVQWIFQCSADDYSLPDRVKVCMEAVAENDCAIVACGVQFVDPATGQEQGHTGWPRQSQYVNAGEGMTKLVYGSSIQGFRRSFLEKVGSAMDHTMDVFYGFLGALDLGYYYVNDIQHVHCMHAAADNMGFQGKMRGVAEGSDELARLNELNRFQLLDLYYGTALKMYELYPMTHDSDKNALLNMILSQSAGWLQERKALHDRGITPGVM